MSGPNSTQNEAKGSGLASNYLGENVRVFMSNGSTLTGVIKKIDGCEALVCDEAKGRESYVNLNFVIAMSKL